ncbi:beta strand repeat-containing protein, partial [Lacinutrix mariniflava]|uniref:beta strand repeat-containing protein n=1 Tax=Lacinutrix mariniflava TaxID=342955 RepID=UPI0019D3A914
MKVYTHKYLILIFILSSIFSFSQTQSPSIQTGVTFQWSDNQNAGINNPATINSVTVNGDIYNTFVIPTSYEMTILGPDGNSPNMILENGTTLANTSSDPNWNTKALSAFQDKNLNHYFTANPNGENMCGNFTKAEVSNAQRQTIFYSNPIPSNQGGILAVTERGGNNCFYVEVWGIPVGGGPEQQLGNTFVRNSGDYRNCSFGPPINNNTDYWRSGRCNENGQTIGIGLFYLNSIAPTGSKITKIEFVGATRDHGDGKFFLLQKYAQDADFDECINSISNGDLNTVATAPDNSTFSLVSGPSTAGQSFSLAANGNYSYTPTPGFTGTVTFRYRVCLPAPNQVVCDEATITLNYQPLPGNPVLDTTCNNINDSSTITVTSPVGSEYTYSINGGPYQSSPTFNNLAPGSYTVLVSNTIGCSNSTSTTINNIIEISNVASTNAACDTGNTGSIDITISGGTAPYTYAWSNGTPTQDLNNIPAGTYSVLVTDTNGCEAYMDNIIVGSQDNANPVITVPNALSIEGCDANDITVSNSVFDYSSTTSENVLTTFNTLSNYNANDDNNVQSVTYIDNITSSVTCTIIVQRTFTAIDDCGNISTATSTITIRDTTPPDLTNCNLVTQTNEECSSSENETTVNNWNASNVALLQSCSIDNCTDSSNLVITSNYVYSNFINSCGTSGSITVTYTVKDECNNSSTINATITIEDNTGPDLSNCTAINQTVECDSQSIQSAASSWNNSNIDALRNCGTDNCDVTATNNVTSNFNFSDFVPNACGGGTIEAEYSVIDDCGNVSLITGTFTIEDTTPPTFNQSLPGDITVSFDNIPNVPNISASDNCGDVTVAFNETESGDICTGSYTITRTWVATDDCNLSTTHTQIITVNQPVLSVTVSTVTNVLCNSEATGNIDITVTGGTGPYSFVWNDSGNSTTEDLSNVIAGAYNVTITDANDCTTSIGATISEPTSPLSLNITKIDATSAQGCANGEATAIVSGGTPTYTYQWSTSAGNQTTATATNLVNGTHSVTITDANNCELTQSVVIECVNTCDTEIVITNITDVLCTGDTTGASTVTANSGSNPAATFTFTWSTGQVDTGVITSTLANLTAGVYSVSVTIDGTVCRAVEKTIAIIEPSNALDITATTTDESGPTTGDGTATAVVTGGVEPYTYSWTPNGETTSQITGLSSSEYCVTVTDTNGCTDTTCVTVNPGTCNNLSVTGTSTPAVCFGDSNGSITATVTGGSGNFTYAWDTISNTTASVSNLPAADYTITVTDTTTLCTTSATITINEPNVLSSAIAVSNILCRDDATGSLDLAVNGGTAQYSFLWSNGSTNEDLINVVAGTYSVTITDNNGCTATNSATIIQPDTNVSASITDQTNILCDGLGAVTVVGAGGIEPLSYSIDGGTNYQTNGSFNDLSEGNYTVTVLDANGCTFNQPIFITNSCINVLKSATIAKGEECLNVGSEVTYTFTLTNTGNSNINTIVINDELLGGLITVTPTGDSNGNAILEPTETWVYTTANYTVTQEDIDTQNITNTVTADGQDPNNVAVDQATDTFIIDGTTGIEFCDPTNGLNIVKTAAIANGDPCLVLGSEVTYTFTLTNTGTVSVNTIVINDELLGGLITVTPTGDSNGNAILEPTETWVYTTANYTVTQEDIDTQNITNTVTADGQDPNNVAVEVYATDTFIIDGTTGIEFCDPTNGLNIVKTA